MEGASMRSVQMLLGHKSIKTTERYAHMAPEVLRETIDLLENRGHIAATVLEMT